ncbi:MAG TPA: nucleoside triphosphate pyrophosphohydrolase [Egibacteraceae bacterium]|nr:nucleoside triphosphate pyrophosphohydrolase [Egibacteraceae bacterium]
MARLVLVDTCDQLPGLLPMHGWSALMSSDLVVVGSEDHPFVAHLALADLRYETVPPEGSAALGRTDLLSGMSPARKRQAERVVEVAEAHGEVTYLFGPDDSEPFTRALGMEAARRGVEVEMVYFMLVPKGARLLDLVRVQERLLAPDGCPWDREQTHDSLLRYAVEEVYELAEAVAAGDVAALREELGDVLLQVVFHAQLAEQADDPDRRFTIDDVAGGIAAKLVRRHPHVFGDARGAGEGTARSVMASWEELKAAEKPEREGVFDGVVAAQPALGYATKLQSRAARLGFDWEHDADAADRVRAELDELLAAERPGLRVEELGDLLLSVVGLARRLDIDPEAALRGAARRFRARFEAAVARAGRPLSELTRADWLALWEAAKAAEASEG